MSRLLVVHHSVSPAMGEALDWVTTGAQAAIQELGTTDLQVDVEPALSATASDLLAADAAILGTPANIGYMSGAMKHFFDQIYYPTIGAKRDFPFGFYVHGNDDCTGAVAAISKIGLALGWQPFCAPVVLTGETTKRQQAQLTELGESGVGAALGLLHF